MDEPVTCTGELAGLFADAIATVDETIGENRDYGAGIGPHDEDDQIDALVTEVRTRDAFAGTIATMKSNSAAVRYPSGRSADLVIETPETTEYCEAKLFRFQKANENPSPQGFSKVFNPYQDRNPRSFLHDVTKLASADVRATKTFLGIYYRPVTGAGTDITGEDIALKFGAESTSGPTPRSPLIRLRASRTFSTTCIDRARSSRGISTTNRTSTSESPS